MGRLDPDEYGVPPGDDNELILRREIQAGGRTRLLVNDQPVTVSAVRKVATRMVEIHGQNEHVALFSRDAQLGLLDQFAGVDPERDEVRQLHSKFRQLETELEGLSQNDQERLRALDLLSFQVRELEKAGLQAGEDVQLEEERRVLANMEKVRAAASSAYADLYEDEGAALARLASAARQLDELQRYDASVSSEIEPRAAAHATLEDIADFLRSYLGKLEANPARLEEIEDRLALIDRLKRKYGASVEEILAYREKVQKDIAGLEHADERRESVRKELAQAAAKYRKAAENLSDKRHEAGKRLVKVVREELAQLGMEKTRLEIQFERASEGQGSAVGIDVIEFRISPNVGEELRPIEEVASGGEISRLMLALKTVVGKARVGRRAKGSKGEDVTFIFDEVDAGVGGRVAESVGQRLKRLSRDAQVLCVTHLAQIACFADHHFYVEKSARGNRTVTTIKSLGSEKDRAEELARMLSGSQITDSVLKHATTMLRQAAG